nr:PREDICTED: uncharacterized protein LOC108195382 [Daucus carota subsp. sativus]
MAPLFSQSFLLTVEIMRKRLSSLRKFKAWQFPHWLLKLENGSNYGDGLLDARLLLLRQCCLIIWRIPSWLMPSKIFQWRRKSFEKVIQGVSETTDLSDPHNLAAGNMILE